MDNSHEYEQKQLIIKGKTQVYVNLYSKKVDIGISIKFLPS